MAGERIKRHALPLGDDWLKQCHTLRHAVLRWIKVCGLTGGVVLGLVQTHAEAVVEAQFAVHLPTVLCVPFQPLAVDPRCISLAGLRIGIEITQQCITVAVAGIIRVIRIGSKVKQAVKVYYRLCSSPPAFAVKAKFKIVRAANPAEAVRDCFHGLVSSLGEAPIFRPRCGIANAATKGGVGNQIVRILGWKKLRQIHS